MTIQLTGPRIAGAGGAPLRARTLADLLDADLPPREPILEGLMQTADSLLLWAATGVGKTFASLSIALAVGGGGSFLGWRAPRPMRVMIIDGEMNLNDLQARLSALMSGIAGCDPDAARQNIVVIARQDQHPDADFPDLATREGQDAVIGWAREGRFDLVILDNFSTLAQLQDENSASAMDPVLAFLLRLKQAGVATILIHHSGKSGETYRGSSKIAATFEVIIGLKQQDGALARPGAAFDLTFEKVRGRRDARHATTSAWLEEGPGGGLKWAYGVSEVDSLNRMAALVRSCEYRNQREVAKALGVSEGQLSKLKGKAQAAGVIREGEWRAAFAAAQGGPLSDELGEELDEDGEGEAGDPNF